jgi:hypothetical protein
MKKTGLMERQFLGYISMVYNIAPKEIPEVQLNQLRQAFYAGAAMYQGSVLGAMPSAGSVTPEEEAAAMAVIHQYQEELEAFAEAHVQPRRFDA